MLFNLRTLTFAARLASALSSQDIPSDAPLSSLLDSAQSHLSRGETSDALALYDSAIQRDPSNYLTFFKRATVYLSLGRSAQATGDFNKALELKPNFEAAHVQLGKIKQRAADWDGARTQFRSAKASPSIEELLTSLDLAEQAYEIAKTAEQNSNWDECVNQAGVAIVVANRAASLRKLRAQCRFARGDVEGGISDLQHVLQIKPGDVSPHLVISAIYFYSLGDTDKGIAQVRRCLQSDPDSKTCRTLLRQEKLAEKTLVKVDKAFSKNQPSTATKSLVPAGENPGLIQEIRRQVQDLRLEGVLPASAPDGLISRLTNLACQGYYEMTSKKTEDWCESALRLDDKSLYGLLYKHKTQLDAELYDAAIETLHKAKDAHPDQANIVEPLLKEAHVQLKRSKTKDYYKVLGVSRDADERQIKSAYRKLSKLHHPDKAARQGLTKEDAEKKMASINEAYEVLSNPELRARFDQGEDPMSNSPQNPFQGSPFGGGGGQPFMFQQGAGSQQFKFQFGGGFPFHG